ncbi:MAG: O-acetyl-ADP-ribose deacetylase [Desulfohalobiaceae bacterium]|nr:O-acetyl-ADP-ribose deacetylase [Desulfohalobiaceae bacterium]
MKAVSHETASGKLVLRQGDITKSRAQAIVNAANSSLMGGGGVDGAIHRAAGPKLLEACREIVQEQGQLPPGEAVITPGFELPARYVIHTVGPVWQQGNQGEAELLQSAYRSSIGLAAEYGLTSLAFPAISCGVYGFPVELASELALKTIASGLEQTDLEEISMYLFSEKDLSIWANQAEKLFGKGTEEE